MSNRDDFKIGIGLEASKAEKAIKELEKRILNIGKIKDSLSVESAKAEKANLGVIKEQARTEDAILKKEGTKLNLLQKALKIREAINRAEARSAGKKVSGDDFTALKSEAARKVGGSAFGVEKILANPEVMKKFEAESAGASKSAQNLANKLRALQDAMLRVEDGDVGELNRLKSHFRKLSNQIGETKGKASAFREELKKTGFVAASVRRSIGNLARAYISIYTAIQGFQFVRRTINDFQSLQATLLTASDGQADAAQRFEWVKKKALELGLPLKQVGQGYARISAAAEAANLNLEETNQIFEGAAAASVAAGLSPDDTQGVMRAFTQMVSKQQVMAEELRNQLSERLPTAMADMAKAVNLTVPEMNKMMERGELTTEHVVGMAKAMEHTAKSTGAFAAGLNTLGRVEQRFINRVQEVAFDVFNDQAEGFYKDVLTTGESFLQGSANFLQNFVDGIFGVVRMIWTGIVKPVIDLITTTLKGLGLLFDLIFDRRDFALNDSVNTLNENFAETLRMLNSMKIKIKQIFDLRGAFNDLGEFASNPSFGTAKEALMPDKSTLSKLSTILPLGPQKVIVDILLNTDKFNAAVDERTKQVQNETLELAN